ncbi:MAG: hypothetical protein Q4D27_08530 [Coriobacteriia bacterium]|nr:hypothetical protein [Coriobacteriia bacterium]
MATDGMWIMNEDYEFELAPEYSQMLFECRLAATKAWRDAMLDYLEPRTIYTREQLKEGLMARNDKTELDATERVNEFVLEALGGDL